MRRYVPAVVLVTIAGILVPTAAQAAPVRTIITAHLAYTTSANSTIGGASLTCPAGAKVLGAGGTVSGADHAVALSSIYYRADGSSAYVAARDYGYPGGRTGITFTVDAWAICVTGTVGGYEIVTRELPVTGEYMSASLTAACPVGKRVIAAGGSVANAWLLDSIDISADLSQVQVEEYVVPGSGARWPYLVAQAVCVTPSVTHQRIAASSSWSTSDRSVSATCPSSTLPYGVSGGLGFAYGAAIIRSLTFTGSTARIGAHWLNSVPAAPWYAYLHVVCA